MLVDIYYDTQSTQADRSVLPLLILCQQEESVVCPHREHTADC